MNDVEQKLFDVRLKVDALTNDEVLQTLQSLFPDKLITYMDCSDTGTAIMADKRRRVALQMVYLTGIDMTDKTELTNWFICQNGYLGYMAPAHVVREAQNEDRFISPLKAAIIHDVYGE